MVEIHWMGVLSLQSSRCVWIYPRSRSEMRERKEKGWTRIRGMRGKDVRTESKRETGQGNLSTFHAEMRCV